MRLKTARLLCFLFAAALLMSLAAPSALAADLPTINSRHALLVEPASGEVLFEKDADEKANPASLTKVMTALLILEYGKLDETVTVAHTAIESLHPDSSTVDLRVGEEISMENLLSCILIASGNDACNAVAEHISGSIAKFVDRMNERAAELGCTNTHFSNTNGLTADDHYTTARDLYRITREALQYPKFLEVCNTASITIPATNKSEERYYYTTNHLISPLKLPGYVYPYAKGIKTGHTSAAGNCLISSAEKNDLFLVSVVMGAEKNEETGKIMSFVDTKNLFEWAFSNFSYQTIISSKEPVTEVKVRLAKDTDYVVLNTSTSVEALLPNDFNPADVEREIVIYDQSHITAPITRGQKLGELNLTYQGRSYGTLSLVALNSVARDQTLYYIDQVQTFFGQTWVRLTLIGLVALLLLYFVFVILYNRSRQKGRRRTNYKGRSGYRRRGRR